LALALVVVGSGMEYGAAIVFQLASLFFISLLNAEGNSLIPNGKVILVPFEADLKVMVLSNDFEDCVG
jgi:hypothetical protein